MRAEHIRRQTFIGRMNKSVWHEIERNSIRKRMKAN